MLRRSVALSVVGVAVAILLSACGTTNDAGGATLTPQMTNANADNEAHPYVGLVVFQENGAGYRCSGTLIAPTVFLTAGHCTYGVTNVHVYFDENVDANPNYPWGGSITGTAHAHPQYDPSAFYLHDLGVVILDSPVTMAEYGSLPDLHVLDSFASARGQQDATVTAVGYGLQASSVNGKKDSADRIRLKAVLDIVDLNGTVGIPAGTSVMVSGNHHTGGTCFGDSGGPMFLQDSSTVVAVTSFGLNGNCAGVGGGYRVDEQDDLDFVNYWLAQQSN